MDKLIILGLYKRKNIFLTAKVSHEFLFNNCNIEARKHIDIFYLKQRKLKRIPENDELYSEVIKSLLDYLRKCSESRNFPLLQKDLDLY